MVNEDMAAHLIYLRQEILKAKLDKRILIALELVHVFATGVALQVVQLHRINLLVFKVVDALKIRINLMHY